MFKKLGLLTILVVLALMTSVPAVSAQGGPPPDRGQPQGQTLATGSIHVQPGLYDPEIDIHINFNVRGVNFVPADDDYPWDHYEATGHLFWREGGEINRVNVHLLEIWEHAPGLLCTYISGFAHSGPRAGQQLCFMICDNNLVLGAAWGGSRYFGMTPVLSGNVNIKPY